jgi:hypothetical protein
MASIRLLAHGWRFHSRKRRSKQSADQDAGF